MLNIVLECNDGYFEPAYLTILSIVRRTKANCTFYILTGDFSEIKPKFTSFSKEKANYIRRMIKHFNPKSTLKVLDFKDIYNQYFSDLKIRKFWKKYWAPYVFLKMFIPFIPGIHQKALHLDCDILVNGDIKEIFDLNMNGAEALATRDLFTRYKYFKKYFNGGVILFDTDKCRNSTHFKQAIRFIKNKLPLMGEQDALSHYYDIQPFPGNDFRYNWQQDGIKDDTLIKHFWSFVRLKPNHRYIRPWHIEKVQKVLKLHNWDEDYKFFLKEQKKWKKN